MHKRLEFKDLRHLVEHQAKIQGDRPFINFESKTVSFKQFKKKACGIAGGLLQQGARMGDGVAIFMENCPEFLCCAFGLPWAGMYIVPVNTELRGAALRFLLTHSDVRFLIADDVLYGYVAELEMPIGSLERIFVRRTGNRSIPDNEPDLDRLLQFSGETDFPEIASDVINAIIYTSGTTGVSKGVVIRQRTGDINLLQHLADRFLRPDDVLFTVLPLYHANALQVASGLAMCAGIPLALEKRFVPGDFWRQIRRHGATVITALAGMIPALMRQPELPDDAVNPARVVLSAACPADLWEPFEKRFGLSVWEAYSAVDGGGAMTINMGNAPVGSVGRPIQCDWRLVDDAGQDVPVGDSGELVTRPWGEEAFPVEFYKDPKSTREKTRAGWNHSGDIFYADREGNLYFVDRKMDTLRFFGEKLSTIEIERVVESFPGVEICAAGAIRTEREYEEVMIWVQPGENCKLDLKALIHHCLEHLAYFMVPRFIEVVNRIPLTGTLKVRKQELILKGATATTWDRKRKMPHLKLNPLYNI